jgi:hypothetical protein
LIQPSEHPLLLWRKKHEEITEAVKKIAKEEG